MAPLSFLVFVLIAAVCHSARNPCPQYMWRRKNGCKLEAVFRIPIDEGDTFTFTINSTLNEIPNENKNLHVDIENIGEVQTRETSHIVYVVGYPKCDVLPEIYKATLNGVDWCTDRPQEGYKIMLSIKHQYHRKKSAPSTAAKAGFADGGDQTPDGDSCGIQKEIVPVTIKRNTINEGEFPWMAALYYFNRANNIYTFVCNANLISSRHIITSAECVAYLAQDYIAVLGKASLINWASTGKIVQVRRIEVHPRYKRGQSGHDMAIFILANPVAFTNKIVPICLWGGGKSEEDVVVDWGLPLYDNLRKTSMAIAATEECSRSHADVRRRISADAFCAVDKINAGQCGGEVGAGFMSKIQGRYYLRGVVSSGISLSTGQCAINHYSIFAAVDKNANWIDEVLKKDI